MLKFRRYSALLLPVTLVFFLNACVSRHTVNVPLDQALEPGHETVAVHWHGQQYELYDPQVADEILTGVLSFAPPVNYAEDVDEFGFVTGRTSTQPVIIYVSASFDLPTEAPSGETISVAIPLTDVTKVEIREVDPAMTIVRTLGGMVLVSGIAFAIILATKDSCPFIYVQEGDDFHLVGEIYSGAIHPPLERHDYMPLPVSGEGKCNLKITNEVLEIQHTNLAELVVFDHAVGERVLMDRHGVPHRVAQPLAPVEARSLAGEDIRVLVAEDDEILFLDGSGVKSAAESGLDGMVLTFDRPDDAQEMRLVVNARNNPWLDHVLGMLFERMGDMFKPWQEAQKSGSAESMRQWSLAQGLPLSVAIQTADGWREVDYFDLPGPIAARDAVVAVDLSGCQGDQVTVKLECGYRFWEIDSVLADFSAAERPQGTSVSLAQAVTSEGEDVTANLVADDDQYLHQPDVGDETALVFSLPALVSGLERSVILHSKGHYDILRNPDGRPDAAFVASFRQPGRVPEYSRDMYQAIYGVDGN